MLIEQEIYSLNPPYGGKNNSIKPTTPGITPPPGCGRIPGYLEKIRAVWGGALEPFWGEAYALGGPGPPADFVAASPMLEAMSEALRQGLIESGVQGIRYYPIRVDGRTTMYLFGTTGRAGIDPTSMELRLLDGAEIGIYDNSMTCVSPRVAERIRAAKLNLDVERVELAFGFPGGSVEGP